MSDEKKTRKNERTENITKQVAVCKQKYTHTRRGRNDEFLRLHGQPSPGFYEQGIVSLFQINITQM